MSIGASDRHKLYRLEKEYDQAMEMISKGYEETRRIKEAMEEIAPEGFGGRLYRVKVVNHVGKIDWKQLVRFYEIPKLIVDQHREEDRG